MDETLLHVALSFLGAVGGAFLGSRQFVRERTWDAKHKAYQDIVEAIHKISYWAEQHHANVHMLPTVSSDGFTALAAAFEDAREQLWRYVSIGGLLISDAARQEVEELRDEIERSAYYYEEARDPENEREVFAHHCDLIRRAVSKHLPEIIRIAKTDLRGHSVGALRRTFRSGK